MVLGRELHGELGDGVGDGLESTTPVKVTGLTGITQIAGGDGDTAFALRNDGTVWGWGDNEEGGLGDGTTTDHRTPVPIPGLSNVRMVAAGAHSDAVLNDGTVLGWGANDRGQLGNGTVGANQLTPVVVPTLTGVTQVAVGSYHSLALLSNGTVLSWGWNANGRLGDGSVTDRSSPVPVSGLAHATAVSAGSSSAAVVALPYFSMSLSPISGLVHAGGAATTQVRLTGINGYTSKTALSVTGLPSGVTATFSPPAASPSVPSTLTLHTSLGTPNGTYGITVVATSSASAEPTRTAAFRLVVTAPAADFTISLSEPFGQAGAGASDSTQIQVNPINGYAETVTASAVLKPLPLGMTLTLSATPMPARRPRSP